MEKSGISFFVMNVALLFVVISFILIVFDLHRFAFVLELMVLLAFMFLLAFSMFFAYHGKQWGWTLSGAVLVLLLINVFLISVIRGEFQTEHLTAIFFSIIGIIIALFNLRSAPTEDVEEDFDPESYYEKINEYYPYIDKMEVKAEIKTEIAEIDSGLKSFY